MARQKKCGLSLMRGSARHVRAALQRRAIGPDLLCALLRLAERITYICRHDIISVPLARASLRDREARVSGSRLTQ